MANLIGQRLDKYEILALLGEGGMAAVYRARQANMKRDVAIKVIKPNLIDKSDFVKRFEREAQTVASLSHPFILKVFDYGQQGDLVYLVMELLTGGSLADLIRKRPLSLETTSRMLDQVASALDYAHERGIIHRDLKPQNVLLDEKGNAVLTDFGIVKLLAETTALTQSGLAMGTPTYMSPEQWKGQPADARTDVYALGVMLFEMLTGRLPFVADTPFGLMHMHVYDPPPSIRDLRPDLPPGLDAVIRAALAKDRDERFASAGELAAAFKAALAGQPPVIAPPRPKAVEATQIEMPVSPSARHRTPLLVGGGALIVVLLLIGLFAVLSGGQNRPSQTPTAPVVAAIQATTPAAATTAATPTAAALPSQTPNMNTLAAATIVQRSTNTALAAASFTKTPTATPTDTPNAQQTVVAMVVLTDAAGTAIMIASYTKTPSLTATRTLTRVPPSPTIPPTATRTPTFTPLPPNLTASGSCTLSGQATFTVTNTGGDMTSAANYTITGPAGTVKSGTIQLKAGQSTTVSVQGVLGLLTFSANVGGVTISANTTCVESTKTPAPPSVTAQGTCTDQGASFTITNASGGDMTTADTYTVTDAKGNVLKSGTFQLKQGESLTVTVTGVTGVVTLKSSTTKLNVSIDCKPPTPRQHQASRCAAR